MANECTISRFEVVGSYHDLRLFNRLQEAQKSLRPTLFVLICSESIDLRHYFWSFIIKNNWLLFWAEKFNHVNKMVLRAVNPTTAPRNNRAFYDKIFAVKLEEFGQ